MVWTLYEDFKKVIKLLINGLVLYEGSEKVIQNIISEGDRNLFYRWKYWIPVFTGMTKQYVLLIKMLDSRFPRFREDGNDKIEAFAWE